MSQIRHHQQQQQRCLWKRNDDFVGGTKTKKAHDDIQFNKYFYYYYEDIYPKYVHATGHRRCSRFVYIANTVVVVQEFVLSTYFLAWHRMMMIQQQDNKNINHSTEQEREKFQFYINVSMISIYVALLLAVIVNSRAATHIANGTISPTTTNTTTMIPYKNKVFIRILDALLLSILLRFIAALLHHLTLSYSTDTVERCAIAAMVIHVLFCDYNYANGYYQYYNPSKSSDCTKDHRPSAIRTDEKKPRSDDGDATIGKYNNNIHHRHRTSFMGGTISLNAAFFATIVLVSRFQNIDSSTTTTFMSFTFISLSVILFAFYPTTRHNIPVVYSATHSVFHWLITACIITSTVALLIVLDRQEQLQHELQESVQPDQQHYRYYKRQNYVDTQFELIFDSYTNSFLVVVTFLGFVIPIWKHYLLRFKVSVHGPWDIPTKESMVLDYRIS